MNCQQSDKVAVLTVEELAKRFAYDIAREVYFEVEQAPNTEKAGSEEYRNQLLTASPRRLIELVKAELQTQFNVQDQRLHETVVACLSIIHILRDHKRAY